MTSSAVERIGGKRAISLIAWAWLAPPAILGFSLATEVEALLAHPAAVFGSVALSYLATGLVFLVAIKTYLRPAEPSARRFGLAVLTYLAGGVIGGIVSNWLLSSVFQLEVTEGLERILTRAWITMVWSVALSVLLDANDRYKATSLSLQRQLELNQGLVLSRVGVIEGLRLSLIERVKESISAALRNADPQELNRVADQVIRPLSHALFDKSRKDPTLPKATSPKVSIVPVLKRTFMGTGHPLVIGSLAITGPIVNATRVTGLLGMTAMIISGLLIALLVWVLKLVSGVNGYLTGFVILAGMAVMVLVGGALDRLVPGDSVLLVSLTAGNIFLATIILVLLALQQQREEKLRELTELARSTEWTYEKLQQETWAESRRLSAFVHAEIQGRIRAAALSPERLTPVQLEALLAKCLQLLDGALERVEFADFRSQSEDLWEGHMVLEWDIEPLAADAVTNDSFAELAVVEVLREALVNAVRHGHAKLAQVHINLLPNVSGAELRVRVVNDGRVLKLNFEKGLGGELFSQIAARWSMQNAKDGVELLAYIPVAFNPEVASPTHQPGRGLGTE